jgi:putative ABC transport system ATP-binding protein
MNESSSEIPVISVTQLNKQVSSPEGELQLLDNIEFDIKQGESVAIVGPSGAGKSTLLGILAGLDVPSSGEVRLNGELFSVCNEDERAIKRGENIGFVFQSFQLLPTLTALENVMLPLELMTFEQAPARATEVLDRVGLGHRVQHYPRQLSGGEQQRVALARAFAPMPRILLADEPTGNLDNHTGQKIVELMFELNQENGTTLILVTHDESLAARCNRRLQLLGGKLQA